MPGPFVAVCGGYFALVPFLKAIEPSPSIGEAAQVNSSAVHVKIVGGVTVNTDRKPTLVANQLRPKTHKASKPKKPATKKKHAVTVPTRPVLVNNPVPTHSSSTPTHTSTAPTHTQSTPTHTTKKPVAPSRNRRPVVGITSQQGSGLAGRGGNSGDTVTGGVSSTPGH